MSAERLCLACRRTHPHNDGVKAPSIAVLTFAILASATVLEGVAYADRADACWFQRLPQAERPVCCDLVGKTRFTLPGGDCCKLFTWDEGDPRAMTDVGSDVAPAMIVLLPRIAEPVAPALVAIAAAPRARAPPWRPTDTVRLLI